MLLTPYRVAIIQEQLKGLQADANNLNILRDAIREIRETTASIYDSVDDWNSSSMDC